MFNLDNIGIGLETLIIGMLVVFLALAIIWLIVSLVGMAFRKKESTKKEQPEASNIPPVSEIPIVLADTNFSVSSDQAPELAAVIAAAICEYENKPLGSFRVVSFKKR